MVSFQFISGHWSTYISMYLICDTILEVSFAACECDLYVKLEEYHHIKQNLKMKTSDQAAAT